MSRGSVTKYASDAGETLWQYRIECPPYPDGRRCQKARRGFATEEEGWIAARQVLSALDQGTYVDPSRQPLGAYLAEWLETTAPRRKPTTNHRYADQVKRWDALLGKMPLGKLSTLDVQRAINRLQAQGELSPGGIRQMHLILSIALKQAVKWKLLPHSPARGVTLPTVHATDEGQRAWTPDEQARFLTQTAPHGQHALWRLLLDSGMRNGEARALRWDDCTFGERPAVRIARTITQDANGRETMGEDAKTPSGRRVVSLEAATAEALEALRRTQRQHGHGWAGADLVFPNTKGSFIGYGAIRHTFQRASALAGVPVLPLHGLRRTMCTTWLRAGISPRTVADRMGHRSMAYVMQVYSEVSQEWQEEGLRKVEAFRREAAG